MKKILVFFVLIFSSAAFADENWDSAAQLNRVNTIGTKILRANGVKANIKFHVSNEEDINAYADTNKEIYVYKGLLQYVSNNDELAAVISHEIGHIVNGHGAKQGVLNTGMAAISNVAAIKTSSVGAAAGYKLATSKLSRHDEFEADLTGVDLMTNAGYNPLAAISVLNRICGNYFDVLETHPSGEKRLMNIYNYVDYNYPAKVKAGFNSDSYTKALTVITPKVEKRKNSKLLTKKYEKEQQNLLKRKQKRLKKIAKTTTGWDGCYQKLTNFLN